MYIPKTRQELFEKMGIYIGYAPEFTGYKYFNTFEEAELDLYKAINSIFENEPEDHSFLTETADFAFDACRAGNVETAREAFGIIMDELRTSAGFEKLPRREIWKE